MAVQRRVNFTSQQRVDVPDMRSLESAASNDMDQLIQAFITGANQGYILRGFEISMAGSMGGAASGLQMIVDPGAVLHVKASQSGTFLVVPAGTSTQQLNSATNSIVDGAFLPSAINYIGIDYERFIDDTTASQVYIWDPTTNSETTKTIPRAQILRYRLKISTSAWASNVLPIATVVTDAGNNVVSITDCRWMLFRLGQGGASPDPLYQYPWTAQTEGRTENPVTSGSNSINPFHGGDKMLATMKDWMNAVMTSIQEIKGTTYWYSGGTAGSLETMREDFGNTVATGAGAISHGILPNTFPVLDTTGNTAAGSDQLTSLASVTGIVAGQVVIGNGIPSNITVLSVAGFTVTLSGNAVLTLTGSSIAFYDPNTVTLPGQVNWDKDIFFDVIGSRLKYKIKENDISTDITLSNDQVAYIDLVRNVAITPNLIFNNGVAVVTSVGSVSWTSLLTSGDWIKKSTDSDSGYYEIASVDSLFQVTLTELYGGTSTGVTGTQSKYAFGSYQTSPTPIGNPRAIQIANRKSVVPNQDMWWFLYRTDNGGSIPRVYVRFIGQELEQGDTNVVNDGVPSQLLQYVGSPMESASKPMYVSAINPGSIPQITSITTGAAGTMASGQYFLLFSSGSDREYYVWIKKNGIGSDPTPIFNAIGIQWDVTTGQGATQTAAKLATALNSTFFGDFKATSSGPTVTVTNNSSGATSVAANFNVGAPFAVSTPQLGTGTTGNYSFQDGDNLTLAIKKLDNIVTALANAGKQPGYDETVTIVTSGETPPTSLNGPIVALTSIQLPDNSRTALPVFYEVGAGKLEVFLNGQKLILGKDYTEIGLSGAPSNQIQITFILAIGDELEFLFSGGGGGGGGGGTQGPPGPQGPLGPPGADAIGGPVAISTKTSSYAVLLTDNVLLADCSSGPILFTLPAPASGTGQVWFFKKIDSSANAMSLNVSGGATIDGLPSQSTIVQYETFTLVTDGSVYWII